MDQPSTPARAERRTPRTFDFIAFLQRENAIRLSSGKPLMGMREREYWRSQYPYARKTA